VQKMLKMYGTIGEYGELYVAPSAVGRVEIRMISDTKTLAMVVDTGELLEILARIISEERNVLLEPRSTCYDGCFIYVPKINAILSMLRALQGILTNRYDPVQYDDGRGYAWSEKEAKTAEIISRHLKAIFNELELLNNENGRKRVMNIDSY